MENMKLKNRMFIGFGTSLILAMLLGIIGLTGIGMLNTGLKDYRNTTFMATKTLNEMLQSFRDLQKELYRCAGTLDEKTATNSVEEIQTVVQSLRTMLFSTLPKYYNNQSGNLEKLNGVVEQFEPVFEDVLEDAKTATTQKANAALFLRIENELKPQIEEIDSMLSNMIQEVESRGETMTETLEARAKVFRIVLFIVFIYSMGMVSFVAIRLCRGILIPIEELKNSANQMAEGNLDVNIQYESKNELGILADCMRNMADTLKSYIGEIKDNMSRFSQGDLNIEQTVAYQGDFVEMADSIMNATDAVNTTLSEITDTANEVSVSSDVVSSGAQTLSQGAMQQASAIEELAATVNDISSRVKENATNAQEANDSVLEVMQAMEDSNKKMEQAVQAIQEIDNSSNQISKIIKTIEDIAFQTNILALNAAVEAARAGSAGKGFAVVADEVRNLASKSSEASKNTADLIDASLIAVKNGMQIVTETAESLLNAVEGSKSVTTSINKITEASKTQADAIGQVTIGIDQISDVVQTNSASAQQSAAASQELSMQAEKLKKLVGYFKLNEKNKKHLDVPMVETRYEQPFSEQDYIPQDVMFDQSNKY